VTYNELKNITNESLRDWFKKEKWVRISSSGNIAGPCGTSKNKKNPDRCLPKAKAQSLTKGQRAATAVKKKKAGAKGKTVVKNTKKAKVTTEDVKNLVVGMIYEMKSKLVTLGYNLDAIQDVIDHLQSNYKEGEDFVLHIGRGDDLPNAITFPKGEFRDDHDLNDMLNVAQSDEDRFDAYTDDDLNEKKDDRCTRIAKSKYDTWPSAYASGAVVRCRRGDIWKDVKEEVIEEMNCQHGKYYCNHDKKYKCRKGPKKSR